jgi:hypothetical protein
MGKLEFFCAPGIQSRIQPCSHPQTDSAPGEYDKCSEKSNQLHIRGSTSKCSPQTCAASKACKLGEEELRAITEEAAKEVATELRRKKDRERIRARRQSTKDDKQLRAFSYAPHAYDRFVHALAAGAAIAQILLTLRILYLNQLCGIVEFGIHLTDVKERCMPCSKEAEDQRQSNKACRICSSPSLEFSPATSTARTCRHGA